MLSSFFSSKSKHSDLESVRKALQHQKFGDKSFVASNSLSVGIVIDAERDNHKYVQRIIKNSPADRAGNIHVGDRVLEIDGHCAWTLDLKKCARIVAEASDHVTFTLSRESEEQRANTNTSTNSKSSPATSASSRVSSTSTSPEAGGVFSSPSDSADRSHSPIARLRSDSDASDTLTVEHAGTDGHMEFSVILEKGNVEDEPETFLERMLYTKGHLSFIRGHILKSSMVYSDRWIAVRRGRLIVTKGKTHAITKSLDLGKCRVTKILQSEPGEVSTEYFVGVKHPNHATMYFGNSSRAAVERLARAIEASLACESSVSELKSTPSGYCAARVSLPEDMSAQYLQLQK